MAIDKQDTKTREDKNESLTLNRYKIFLPIIIFAFIINTLCGFDINFLYIRQILSFLFLMFVPGLIIMLCFKIRKLGFWEYLVHMIGLSLAYVLFATLLTNWALPLLNITNTPLTLNPILISFNVLLIILGIFAWARNKDLSYSPSLPRLDSLNSIFFTIPMLFPVLAVLGAFIINNHGPSILTMLLFAGIALYCILLFIFRKRLNENIFPWALWMIGLALLFTFSMRSWFISGNDISLEYRVFSITQQDGVWSYANYRNAYNACLSIIFVPIVYKLILNISDNVIFKVIFPIIFSTLLITVYLFIRRKFDKIFAFIASVFFISWIWFVDPMLTLARQEIAFVFFALMLLVIFSKNTTLLMKRTLFLIYGVSMIVSHYSTSYVALSLLTLTYIVMLIIRIYKKIKSVEIKDKKEENTKVSNKKIIEFSKDSEFYIHGFLLLFLLLFGFLWLSQITTASNGLVEFSQRSTSSLDQIFTNELKIESLNKIAAFGNSDPSKVNLTSLVTNVTSKYLDDYIVHEYPTSYNANYTPSLNPAGAVQENVFFPAISLFYKIVLTFVELLFLLGVLYLVFYKKKNQNNSKDNQNNQNNQNNPNPNSLSVEHKIMIFLSLFFIFLMIVLPYVSLGYNFERLYLQLLMLLCIIPIFGCIFLFSRLVKNKETVYLIFLIVSLCLLLFNYGFFWKLANADTPSFILENRNINYDFLYTHTSEIDSGQWIKTITNSSVQTDSSSAKRLDIYNSLNSLNNLSIGVFPLNINQKSYVYTDYANTIENVLFISYRGSPIRINYPMEFISDNKNKIYNNGESIIFK